MRPLPGADLERMTVARLNAYRKKLLELEAASGLSDISDSETAALSAGSTR